MTFAALAPALAALALARAAGVAHPADCRAWLAWATWPGRDAAALADPTRPAPSGADAPPRVRLVGGDAGLARFVQALPGCAGVAVRTVPRPFSAYDHASRTILLGDGADLADLLHEAGHALLPWSDEAAFQREFREFPGCRVPEDSALYRLELAADAAFGAGLLSAGRASRSYRGGILHLRQAGTADAPQGPSQPKHGKIVVELTGHGPGQPGVPGGAVRTGPGGVATPAR